MSLRRMFQQLVTKNTEVTKATDKPHRFTDLEVGEVSLVTNPAMFTAEEADAGAGVVVCKMVGEPDILPPVEEPEVPPEAVEEPEVPEDLGADAVPAEAAPAEQGVVKVFLELIKKVGEKRQQVVHKDFSTAEGEDLYDAVAKVVNAAMNSLAVHLNDQDVWWTMFPMKVTDSEVILADYWDAYDHPTETYYYKISYTRDGEGAVTTGDVVTMVLEYREVDQVSKVLSPAEKAMKAFKGFKIGGSTFKVTAQPGGEYAFGDTIVVKVDGEGNAHLDVTGHVFAEGQSLVFDDEGFLTLKTKGEEPEVTEETTTKALGDLSMPQVLEMMANSGQSFTMTPRADGGVDIHSTREEKVEPPAEDATEEPETPDVAAQLEAAQKAAEDAEAQAVEARKSLEAAQEAVHKAEQKRNGGGTDTEAAVDAALAQERETKKNATPETPAKQPTFKAFDWMGLHRPRTRSAETN